MKALTKEGSRLILTTLEYYTSGYISPIRPIKVFNAAEAQDAFRYMQKGQHIGRVGISIRDPCQQDNDGELSFETVERTRQTMFDKSASYLLLGGLGGLGRAMAAWMADHNAGELIFLSRSAGTGSRHEAFVTELEGMGCSVKLIGGDITNVEDVDRAIKAASLPLKGVLQMTMVLRDQNFESMTFQEWNEAVAPKIQGTWNVHDATLASGADLDFFVLFSSLSGIVGQPGQANYASANTFLGAMAQYRRGLGLPASVIDIGAVEDIGYLTQNPGLMGKMKSSGFKGVRESELLDAMAVATTPRSREEKVPTSAGIHSWMFVPENAFVLGLGPLSPSSRAVWKRDCRMAAYHNANTASDVAGTGAASSNEILKNLVSSAMADPSVLKTAEAANLLAVEIGKKLFDLLLKPHDELNTSLPLVDLGLDSLVAIELRAWWRQVFRFDITVLEMLGMGSLDALGQHAVEGLLSLGADGPDGRS
jgi:aryl carrier-like protein/NAD(P)-dependent dehydrogenase (short-subunit alcohol dehydrogenase family)